MTAPILLYGWEIWGYENCDLIESFAAFKGQYTESYGI